MSFEHVVYDNYLLKADCYIARQAEYEYLLEDIGFAIEPGVLEVFGDESALFEFLTDLLLNDIVTNMADEWSIDQTLEISIKRVFDSYQIEGEGETYLGYDMKPVHLELVTKQPATAKTMSPFLFTLQLKK